MQRYPFAIDATNAGRRLDAVVRQLCPEVPRVALMRQIRTGLIRVNGRRSAPPARLAAGDAVLLPGTPEGHLRSPGAWPAEADGARRPRRRALPAPTVVYEDGDVLVVDKPAGLACHPGTRQSDDTLTARLLRYLDAEAAPPGRRPGLAQRLDRGVSGLLPVGKHALALRALASQVTAGTMKKAYLALVHGVPARRAGRIDWPLRVDDQPHGGRPRTFVDPIGGSAAITHYAVLAAGRKMALLRIWLETGRTHQIRAHLAALGHPLVGDPRYGDPAADAPLRATYGVRDVMLHAWRLAFVRPADGAPVVRQVAPPAAWQAVLAAVTGPGGPALRDHAL